MPAQYAGRIVPLKTDSFQKFALCSFDIVSRDILLSETRSS
jgi:hypothetical protein